MPASQPGLPFDPVVAKIVHIGADLPWPPDEPYQQSSEHDVEVGGCRICLEDEVLERTAIHTCGHTFCRTCLTGHCKHHSVLPITCPLAPQCKKHLPSDLVQKLVTPEIAMDYLKSYWLVHNKKLHECPICQTLLSSPSDTLDFRCGSCRQICCRQHGREHPEIPCHQWLKTRESRAFQQTANLLREWTKPCSHCGSRLQKSAGCDHVVCTACQGDMCWRCGTHEYLTGQMIRHCNKCHGDFRDHRYDQRYRLRLCLVLPIMLPFMICYVVAASAVFVLSGFFCCFFSFGACLGKDTRAGVGVAVVMVILPFVAVLEDFGVHVALLDLIFPELRGEGAEIPVMDTTTSQSEENDLSDESF